MRGITGLFNLRVQNWTKTVEKQLLLSRGLQGEHGTDLVYCWGALNSSWLHKSLVACVNSQIVDKYTLCSGDALFEEGCLTSVSSPDAGEKEVFSKRPFLKGPFWRYLVAMLYCNVRQCVYFHALPAPDAGATCFPSHCTAVSLCTISEMAFYDICVLAPLGPITCSPSSLCALSLPLQNQCYKCNLLKSPLTERIEKIHEQKFALVAMKCSLPWSHPVAQRVDFFHLQLSQNDINNEGKGCSNLLQRRELYSNICFVPGLEFLVVVTHGDGSGEGSMGDVQQSPLQRPVPANTDNLLVPCYEALCPRKGYEDNCSSRSDPCSLRIYTQKLL